MAATGPSHPAAMTVGILQGVVQHYAWGSRAAIARLQQRATPSDQPEAELWFGAHPRGPSVLDRDGQRISLDEAIAADPVGELGADEPGLSFLVKILAAAQPLSLQLHPDDGQALAGFTAERAAGVAVDSPHANYVDPWGKPEIVIAVERFEALAGFRSDHHLRAVGQVMARQERIADDQRVAGIADALGHGAIHRAIEGMLRLDRGTVGAMVASLMADGSSSPVIDRQLLGLLASRDDHDPGVLVALLLQRHDLQPGQALQVAPGCLHAYLSGTAVEIMGASDNVVRAGLTAKNVDVDEFLRLLQVEAGTAATLVPQAWAAGCWTYPTSLLALRIDRLEMAQAAASGPTAQREVTLPASAGPRIIVAVDAPLNVATSDGLVVPAGAALWVPAGSAAPRLVGDGLAIAVTPAG